MMDIPVTMLLNKNWKEKIPDSGITTIKRVHNARHQHI